MKFQWFLLSVLFLPLSVQALDLSGKWQGEYKSAGERKGKVSLVLKHTDEGYTASLQLDDKKCSGFIPKQFKGTSMMNVINLVSDGKTPVMFNGEYKEKKLAMVMLLPGVDASCSPISMQTYEIILSR